MRALVYLRMLRPAQWLKNLMLFFPPFLGGILLQTDVALRGIVPFLTFCMASSATYIFNDIVDRNNDRQHPIKNCRPLPAGQVSVTSAVLLSSLFVVVAVGGAVAVSWKFLLLIACYILVSAGYSLFLKNYPIVDLFCISLGFLIRLLAGGEVFGILISEWLFLSVFLLALFLSTGKRASEKRLLGAAAGNHRAVLAGYPDGFLDGAMYLTGSTVLVTYTMYVLSRQINILTVPLCTFGLLRYILRVKVGRGGDPTESLLRDIPLLVVSLLWATLIAWGTYVR